MSLWIASLPMMVNRSFSRLSAISLFATPSAGHLVHRPLMADPMFDCSKSAFKPYLLIVLLADEKPIEVLFPSDFKLSGTRNMLAVRSPWKHPRYKPTEECPLPLGSGTFGAVYRANVVVAGSKVSKGKQVAVKIIRAMDKDQYVEAFEKEAAILQHLKFHHNIVRLVAETKSAEPVPRLMIVFELAKKGDLETLIRAHPKGLGREVAAIYFKQLLAGLAHLKRKNVIHRDIKPPNVLCTLEDRHSLLEGHEQEILFYTLKISDFGSGKISMRRPGKRPDRSSRIGTWFYAPPEAFVHAPPPDTNQPRSDDGILVLDHRSDIFGVGMILFELISGVRFRVGLMRATTTEDIERRVLSIKVDDESLEKLLLRILHQDPEKRPSVKELQKRAWLCRNVKEAQKQRRSLMDAMRRASQDQTGDPQTKDPAK